MLFGVIFTIAALTATVNGGYIGCFQEDHLTRVFTNSAGTYDPDSLNPTICSTECLRWGHRYAGLSSGRYCFCSNVLPSVAASAITNCNVPCSDLASGANCGSIDYISVYEVPTPIKNLKITIYGQSDSVVPTNTMVYFNLSVINGPFDIKYALDFGDGSGLTPWNDTQMLQKSFSVPGEYIVTAYASDSLNTTASIVVSVQSPASQLQFYCPQFAGTYTELRCNATIDYGNYLNLTIDYGDGVTEMFSIGDANWFTAGPGIPMQGTQASAAIAGDIYIMPNSQFSEDGLLSAFEFYATTTGAVTFLILQPTCASSTYCFDTNDCSASCLTCSPATSILCPQSGSCGSPAQTSCSNVVSRYSSPKTIASYTQVSAITYTISSLGSQVYNLPSPVAVQKGYIIGYIASTGLIATRSLGSGETSDVHYVSGTNSPFPYSAGSTNFRHLLRGVASKKSSILFFHTYTQIGTMKVKVNVTNIYLPNATPQLSNANITISVGINISSIVGPTFGITNKPTRFYLLPLTGSNVTFLWTMGDGQTVTTWTPYIDYVFTSRGCYYVNNTAFNVISQKSSNQTYVCIEDQIVNLTVKSNVSAASKPTVFQFSMKTGSDFLCNWDYGDGQTAVTNDVSSPITGTPVSHLYAKDGTYVVNVTCHNNVSIQTVLFNQYVQWPIINLRLQKTGALKNTPFNIVFLIDNGTAPTFTMTFDGVTQSISYNSATMTGMTTSLMSSLPNGIHTVVVHAWNQFSDVTLVSNFTIETAILNPLATPLGLETVSDKIVTFTASVSDGTSVNMTWEFDDGSTPYSIALAPLQSVPAGGLTRTVQHSYSYGGLYVVKVTISNNFDSYVFTNNITVYGKIENVTLVSNSPVAYLSSVGHVIFSFSSPKPPFNVQVQFDFGNGNKSAILPFDINAYYPCNYFVEGVYTVIANISNKMSFGLLTAQVIVATPVTNMMLIYTVPHASVGVPFGMNVSMDNGGSVMLHFDFGDPSGANNYLSFARTGRNYYQTDGALHTYNAVGTYVIAVTAECALGNTTRFYILVAQYAISPKFVLTTSGPVKFPPGTINFTLTIPNSEQLPTNASLILYYGDGLSTTLAPLPFTTPPYTYTWSHTYTTDGTVSPVLVISNLASNQTLTTTTGAYIPITGFSAQVKYQPFLPVGGPSLSGFGPLKDTFPINTPLSIQATFATGTPGLFLVTIKNASGSVVMQVNRTSNPFLLNITESGKFTISVVASNPVSSSPTMSYVVYMNHSVGAAAFSAVAVDSPPKSNWNFISTFGDIGPDTCVLIDYGDGQVQLFGNNSVLCQTMTKLTVTAPIYGTLIANHKYLKGSGYFAKLTAFDMMGNTSAQTYVVVSTLDCAVPTIDIKNKSADFTNPTLEYRSKQLDIVSVTQVNCASSLTNTKLWSAYLIDESTGQVIKNIPAVSSLLTAGNAQLTVPPLFLSYGLYRFSYNVSVTGTNFSNVVSTYIRIEATPIVALMMAGGMSMITRGYGTMITLSPNLYSYDPDIVSKQNQTFTSFTWYCRQIDEEFPTLPNGVLSSANPSVIYTDAQLSTLTGSVSKGGCFRQGPGILSFSGGSLTFSSNNMRENDTYVFRVVINATRNRSDAAEVQVDLVTGLPPSIQIGCLDPALCTYQTSGVQVNPGNRLSLYANCTENCRPGMTYNWTAYRLGLNNAWLPIPGITLYVSGINSQLLAISANLFTDGYLLFNNLRNYRFGVIVTSPSGDKGSSYIDVILNNPPSGGSCNVTPSVGISASTQFSFGCQGWQDEQGIKLYQFYALSPDDSQTMIQLGLSESGSLGPIQLNSGSANSNYMMNIYVRIFDNSGAVSTNSIGTIQVTPVSPEEAAQLISSWLNNKTNTNQLSVIAANGDIRVTSSTFLSLADALNSDFVYGNMAQGNGSTTYPNPLALESDVYQTQRDNRATLKSVMIQALGGVTVADPTSVELVASTLTELTAIPSEVNRADQEKATSILDYMVQTLQNQSQSTTLEELRSATMGCMQVIGNLLESITYAQTDGTKTDVKQAKKDPLFFYDTDWESPRQAFVGLGDNAMIKGLSKETNTLVQKNSAQGTVNSLIGSVEKMGSSLLSKLVPGETGVNITTKSASMYVQKDLPSKVTGVPIKQGNSSVTLPTWCSMAPKGVDCSKDTPISLQVITTPNNVFAHFPGTDMVSNYSSTVTINTFDEDGNPLNVHDTSEPIEIVIPRSNMPRVSAEWVESAVMSSKEGDDSSLFYYKFNVSANDTSISIEIQPENDTAQFLVLLRYATFPQLNGTDKGWDYLQNVPISIRNSSSYSSKGIDPYIVFVDSSVIRGRNGTWYAGLRQLDPSEYDRYNESITPAPPARLTGRFKCNFTLLIYTSGCFYCHNGDKGWSSGGCKVSPKTRTTQTVCLCNHLTTFASGFVVQPNKIDFNFILTHSSFMSNPSLYITEIVIAVVYIVAFVWARWQDKKDLQTMGVTPLPDNDPKDKYLYEVTVSTGLRKNAGTDSKVHIIFSGDSEETDARTLEDEKRKVLRRGATDSFLMATPRPLGALNYARIWHDNSGKGKYASWYLNWIVVRDIQTKEKFHFIVNQWFAVEEDDGQISRLISVSGRDEMVATGHLFSKRTTKGLGDDHIWFSIVARPATSRFTRLQRLSCCLCLLFTAMFANAMFYGVVTSSSASGISFGPFSLSPEQIYVGIISNMIVFPVNFLIAYLFKNSKPRYKRPSRIAEAVKKIKEKQKNAAEDTDSFGSATPRDTKPILPQEYGAQAYAEPLEPAVTARNVGVEEPAATGIPKKKKKFLSELPWWCVIVGWVLLWLTMVGCVAGVTFYGIMFQDEKARKWITSMLISFVSSVFLTQPIKVILLALLFSMLFKKPTEEEEVKEEDDEEQPDLEHDEDWLHISGPSRPRTIVYEPPDPAILERAKQNRLKEIQMYEILREILLYSFYIFILITVSYDFRDPNSYNYKNNLLTSFVYGGAGEQNANNSIDLVTSLDNFWNWMDNTFVPNIRADVWYNGGPPVGLRGYLNDYVSRVMGYATIRQLRVRRDLCSVPYLMKRVMPECNVPYSYDSEDKADYGPAWTPLPPSENGTVPNVLSEYRYRQSDELDGFPYLATHELYSGGGYVAELRGDRNAISRRVHELKSSGWLDRYTRGIFLEFATYNSQVNLFGVVTIVAELIESGGFDCYYRFDTMNLLGNLSTGSLFQKVCQGIFVVSIIVFLVKEIRAMKQQRGAYLKQYWNWVELWIIVMSVCCVAMFAYRYMMTQKLLSTFSKSGGNAYMKFTGVAYWNQTLLYVMGVLVFWAMLKFLKLLRFNKTIGLLSSTLRYCSKSLIHFTIMFGLVFFAFIHFFYLTYLSNLEVFADLVRTAEQCLMMMVGKFNFSEIYQASLLGTFMFFLYMVVIFFILMTMFIGIISEGFSAVRDDIKKQSNDYEMVSFILDRFKQWTGLNAIFSNMGKKKIGAQQMEGKAIPYDPALVEAFPERLDRFLDCISQVYFDHDTFESIFQDGNGSTGKGVAKKSSQAATTTKSCGKFDPNPSAHKSIPSLD